MTYIIDILFKLVNLSNLNTIQTRITIAQFANTNLYNEKDIILWSEKLIKRVWVQSTQRSLLICEIDNAAAYNLTALGCECKIHPSQPGFSIDLINLTGHPASIFCSGTWKVSVVDIVVQQKMEEKYLPL
ncbi:hypothetical protein 3 [Wuchang romanomermis nematode virus 2]|uniref:Uncharacterized protein n=1 Tax=Wuchang romanomermis nematode virus 2 TaxID=2773460 RepID=A0A1L3KN35_9MONO|nr:hypothetical protein 3 [Wuchang romanomermis nematode virus 2]APG78783.1 hypothetical protein 3 [Wuchang romanomermis nematode virus 2]